MLAPFETDSIQPETTRAVRRPRKSEINACLAQNCESASKLYHQGAGCLTRKTAPSSLALYKIQNLHRSAATRRWAATAMLPQPDFKCRSPNLWLSVCQQEMILKQLLHRFVPYAQVLTRTIWKAGQKVSTEDLHALTPRSRSDWEVWKMNRKGII